MALQSGAIEPIRFDTEHSQYQHIRLKVDGPVARILLNIQEGSRQRPGNELKLNPYDLGEDI